MKKFKWMIALIVVLLLTAMFSMTAFATNTGNVAGAVEGTWKAASSQIKTVVNNVVFPAIDLVLAVLFFVKVATASVSFIHLTLPTGYPVLISLVHRSFIKKNTFQDAAEPMYAGIAHLPL